ncbi:MAG TPA: YceI family protein [Solirubrobacteraceae bacterium]|nr:YceI family protein [Solirubrobacteraceae bacterium]
MPFAPGHHTLGPDNGTLSVRTRKAGAASKAGHNLLIEVQAWSATLDLSEDGAGGVVALTADPRSLKVVEGTGGISALDDDDKAGIAQTIDEEVLKGTAIAFRSTSLEGGAGSDSLRVGGDLELAGRSHPIAFELTSDAAGTLTGAAVLKQTDWGMKPYSALFGTLKVVDEVTVEVTAQLPADP